MTSSKLCHGLPCCCICFFSGGQLAPQKLARGISRHRWNIEQPASQLLVRCNSLIVMRLHLDKDVFPIGRRDRWIQGHIGHWYFCCLLVVPYSANACFRDKRMGQENILELSWRNLVTVGI